MGQLRHQIELARQELFRQAGNPVGVLLVMKEICLSILVPQAFVQVAARSGQEGIPLGHKGRHQALPGRNLLHRSLKEGRLIRGRERGVILNRGFVHARPGFGVEALDLDVEGARCVQNSVGQLRVGSRSQDAIAEHAG